MALKQITFTGTGTSQGIPVIACECEVCTSKDPKDKRFRTSLFIQTDKTNIQIDTGPDFRSQMLRLGVQKLDAVLFTHEHKDHIGGLDDVRPFNFKQKKDMPVYCNQNVYKALERDFHYVFDERFKYPGIPQIARHLIDKNTPFQINKTTIIPIEVYHYKLPVMAYRIEDFTYITDANYIAPEELDKIKGTKILVINALRKEKHISHFNLEEALKLIKIINPQKAYLTHISHLMGKHQSIELPQNVEMAYDGLTHIFR